MGIFACIPLDSKNFEHRNGVVSLHHKPYQEVHIEWRTFFFKSWINFYLIKMVLRNWCWNGALNCYLWMKSTKNICFTSWFIEVDMILFSKLGHFHLCSFCANKILISICSMQIENVQSTSIDGSMMYLGYLNSNQCRAKDMLQFQTSYPLNIWDLGIRLIVLFCILSSCTSPADDQSYMLNIK